MKHKRSAADSALVEAIDVPVAKKSSLHHHAEEPDKHGLPESAAYHSALINFKVTALLDEVRVTDELARLIEDRFSRLKLSISKMKSKVPKQLEAQVDGLLDGRSGPKSGNWKFVQPLSMSIGGSYACSFSPRKDLVVDVMVVVPKSYFREKDYLNMRYVVRKLAYLTSIAEKLNTCKWVSSVRYSYHAQNVLRPILRVQPSDCTFTFALHVLPEEGTFAAKRFRASRNNVRPRWLTNEENGQQPDDAGDDETLPATPHYNMALLADVVSVEAGVKLSGLIAQSAAVRDALLLLKVWLHQRQLDVGRSSVSGYIIATFVAELMQARRLNASSGCYQLFKAILTALSDSDWTLSPKVGADGRNHGFDDFVMLKDGQQAFDVVLPDVLGCANVCFQLYSSTFNRLRELAATSVRHMDSVEGDFVDLFLVPAPFKRQFDCYVTLAGDLQRLWFVTENQACGEFRPNHDDIVSHCGDRASAVLPCLMRLLRLATAKRLSSLDISPVVYPEWTLDEVPPSPTTLSNVQLGLRFNVECAFSIIDKGPSADDAKAGQFRAFWGDKAEMRRFHDGSICEAVVWPCKTVGARRNVIGRIIKFVLARHLDVPPASVRIVLREMDGFLRSPKFARRRRQKKRSTDGSNGGDIDTYGTGEEQLAATMASFDVLSKRVQSACSSAGLPLSIVSVQGITASFRGTEVFPVLPMKFADDGSCKCTAKYGVLEAVCTLEGSGKWPDDLEAVRRLKAVYLLKLGSELSRAHGLATFHHIDHLSVAQDGYLFSLTLVHRLSSVARDPSAGNSTAALTTDDDRAYAAEDPTRSDRQPSLIDLALLTGYLSGVQAAHSTYGPSARLAKRWASGHLMSDDLFPEVALELLVSHVFLHPHPYTTPPGSPLTGFVRFLQLLATFDWQHLPLVVNFNNELTAPKCESIRDVFKKERAYLPALCVATPCDRERLSLWSLAGPKPFALRRLVLLARRALRLLEEGDGTSLASVIEADFRTSTDVCHAVIHLRSTSAPTDCYQTIQLPAASLDSVIKSASASAAAAGSSVAVNVDVVKAYVQELTEAYGNVALFLYDRYDCKLVGVLWKPNVFQPHDIKSAHLDAQVAATEGDTAKTMLSMSAVLEDFELIGRGLVDRVEILRQPTGK